jgi:tripeptidyl-peptidase-1
MFRSALILVLGAAAAGAVAIDVKKAPRTVMEPDVTIFEAPRWARGERVSGDEPVHLTFFLKHCPFQFAKFHADLEDRSNPASPNYAQWLSVEQVKAKLKPSSEALESVKNFVKSMGGVPAVDKFDSVVSTTVPAKSVEEHLATVLHHHGHTDRNAQVIRAVKTYSLPADVAKHVSVVGDLVRFPRLKPASLIQEAHPVEATNDDSAWTKCGSSYSGFVNPHVLAERYGFEFPKLSHAKGNSLGLAEFQRQYYDDPDLQAFTKACKLQTNVTVSKVEGGNDPKACSGGFQGCVESLLDIEYAGAVAGAIPLKVYYATDYSLLSWANQLLSKDGVPPVHSVSYGNDEAQQTGRAYMDSVNTAFAKLSATGVTILFAAGDQGVWGREGVGTKYHPDFPAGSPYVTAVGGTDFKEKGKIGEETTWPDGGSGFSNDFARPAWQDTYVEKYLQEAKGSLPKFPHVYNASSRAYPDLSALAGVVNAYLVALEGGKRFASVGGTSAASPVVAGIVAQINDRRLSAGKPTLGWLNPALYKCGEGAFHDVTTGKTSGGIVGGFPAAKGWDAATGFGTVQYKPLAKCLVAN